MVSIALPPFSFSYYLLLRKWNRSSWLLSRVFLFFLRRRFERLPVSFSLDQMYVCVCVRVCERKREKVCVREKEKVCVLERVSVRERCVLARKWENKQWECFSAVLMFKIWTVAARQVFLSDLFSFIFYTKYFILTVISLKALIVFQTWSPNKCSYSFSCFSNLKYYSVFFNWLCCFLVLSKLSQVILGTVTILIRHHLV